MDCGPRRGRVSQVWAPVLLWAPFPIAGLQPTRNRCTNTLHMVCTATVVLFCCVFIISLELSELEKSILRLEKDCDYVCVFLSTSPVLFRHSTACWWVTPLRLDPSTSSSLSPVICTTQVSSSLATSIYKRFKCLRVCVCGWWACQQNVPAHWSISHAETGTTQCLQWPPHSFFLTIWENPWGLLYSLPQANKKGDVCDRFGAFHTTIILPFDVHDAKEMRDLSFAIKHGDRKGNAQMRN